MGFRSAIRTGGGFLNNVDGTVESYEFSRKFKGEKKDGDNLYYVPTIQVDGKEKTDDQHIFIGKGDRYEISEDGQELTMESGDPVTFPGSLPFGRLMSSLIDAGFDESELPDLEGGDALELSALNGRRFRFKQEVDEAANEKVGKRKVKDKKTGKMVEYNRTNTVIAAVLGGKAGKSEKSNGNGKSSSKSKKNEEPDEDDLNTEAGDVLKDILAKKENKGGIRRKDLSLPVSKALVKNDNKDALKEMILDEDWQDKQDFIEVSPKGLITLVED